MAKNKMTPAQAIAKTASSLVEVNTSLKATNNAIASMKDENVKNVLTEAAKRYTEDVEYLQNKIRYIAVKNMDVAKLVKLADQLF